MKTTVEWLIDELYKQGISLYTPELIAEAKEMEKEQKIKFAENCLDKALDLDIRTAFSNVEKYYNETFKQEQ
jgi:predicted nucleotide-binding protein (sugar kinase/HSP70/actin superfamily)